MTRDQMMDAIMKYLHQGHLGALLPQIPPMLCRDAKDYFDYSLPFPWRSEAMTRLFFENPKVVAEEKLDGVRMKMHLLADGVRLDTRRRSDVDYVLQERTANFPHFQEVRERHQFDTLEGTVLDGEIVMPSDSIFTGKVQTEGTRYSTIAVTNAGPDVSQEIQGREGPVVFVVFDVVRVAGLDYTTRDLAQRRRSLEQIVQYLNHPQIVLCRHIHTDKLGFFEACLARGSEGVVFKYEGSLYHPGKRSPGWLKLKRFQTADGFITGYIPGEHGFSGLVGALCVSGYKDGKSVEFAAVSQMDLEFRRDITAPDGSLKQSIYNLVIEVRFQELSKTNRAMHAVLFRWRPDKSAEECLLPW